MKGVSAVIAIILILMIVVALAALAWTWFSGIFSSLTETAETSVTATAESMAQNFVIESALCTDNAPNADTIDVAIRNIGQAPIVGGASTEISAYVDDLYADALDVSCSPASIAVGAIGTCTITANAGELNFDCQSGATQAESVKLSIASGLAKSKSLSYA
jgi:FlaG/FlaF family flagellin (archaellin)